MVVVHTWIYLRQIQVSGDERGSRKSFTLATLIFVLLLRLMRELCRIISTYKYLYCICLFIKIFPAVGNTLHRSVKCICMDE